MRRFGYTLDEDGRPVIEITGARYAPAEPQVADVMVMPEMDIEGRVPKKPWLLITLLAVGTWWALS